MGDKMKICFSFSKNYALFLCVFILICFFVFSVASSGRSDVVLENEMVRENYLIRKGFAVDEPFSVKEIVKNGEAYTEYTYITEDKTIIRLEFDKEKLVGESYGRYKTG